jgi:hypothetical protein
MAACVLSMKLLLFSSVYNSYRTQLGFRSVLAFTGQAVDPLLVARTILCDVMDHHLIGSIPIEKAISFSANIHLLNHTSILMWANNGAFLMHGATVRYRPNGVPPPPCPHCKAIPQYQQMLGVESVLFRCRGKEHPMGVMRKLVIKLAASNEDRIVYGRPGDSARHIITKHPSPRYLVASIVDQQ